MAETSLYWPRWWTETMAFVRTVSGTVYEDQLEIYANKQYRRHTNSSNNLLFPEGKGIVDFLNCYVPSKSAEAAAHKEQNVDYSFSYEFLKKHPLTGEIYTVPYSRSILDPALHLANNRYTYNMFLYEDSFHEYISDFVIYDYSINMDKAFAKGGPFHYDKLAHELSIDFSVIQNQHRGKAVAYKDFNLEHVVRYAIRTYGFNADFHIGTINAAYMVFIGETNFSFSDDFRNSPPCCEGACFSGATFLSDVIVQNITFQFTKSDYSGVSLSPQSVDFRNTRFFGNVQFRNVRFTQTTKDTSLTFEDSRISGNFEIFNTNFEHASLYCFQMILGSFAYSHSNTGTDITKHKLSIINTSFESDAHIDFIDIELANGEVLLENIPSIPLADLCFSPLIKQTGSKTSEVCPDITLLVHNCEINGTMKISNVSELSFNSSHNYSRIIEAPDWRDVDAEVWNTTHSYEYKHRTKGIGPSAINNKILLATYNNTYTNWFPGENKGNQLTLAKAYDFVMLKENFASMGLYDAEDIAFILYMEHKPVLDSFLQGAPRHRIKANLLTTIIYKLLYCTGKYGISPIRVFGSLAATVIIFAILFLAIAFNKVDISYSFGLTLVDTSNIIGQALGALLYSLECIVPFAAQFEPISLTILVVSAIENFVGTFLIGYFSVAVIRKTLH